MELLIILLGLVRDLHLPLVTTNSYGVVMGTMVAVEGEGICKGVVHTMQGLTIVQDFLPLELGNTDVVLGMKWLGSLGSMGVNWKQLTMKFRLGNSHIVLQGDLGLNKTRVSLKSMMREIEREVHGVLVEFGNLAGTSPPWPVPVEIQQVMVSQYLMYQMASHLSGETITQSSSSRRTHRSTYVLIAILIYKRMK